MEITDVKSTLVSVAYKKPETWGHGVREGLTTVIVEVFTDEGIIGVGESPCMRPTAELTKAIVDDVKPLILKEDPFDIERISLRLQALGRGTGGGHTNYDAFVGIDMALWDIIGKACNKPLYKLLGGAVRKKVPYMAWPQWDKQEVMIKEARDFVEKGFKTLYIKVAVRPWSEEIELVKSLREAVGDDINIRIDPNDTWTLAYAIRYIKKIERFDIEWVEQPLLVWDIDGMAELRRRVNTPIAAQIVDKADVYDYVSKQAADHILIDPRTTCGIFNCKKAAAIAEAVGIPVSLHSSGELGVATCAFAHLVASTPNFLAANQTMYYQWTEDIIKGDRLNLKDGSLEVPEKPGIGVELDPEKVRRCAENYRRIGYYAPSGKPEEASRSSTESFVRPRL
jgi:L-alanine-DL-glutamate epimerase-like enolase superfamily enzyme